MIELNYLAIFVAAILAFAIGSLWYSPVLFGKSWQKLTGISDADMKSGMIKSSVIYFLMQLVMSFVMATFVLGWAGSAPETSGLSIGLQTGFWIWLGFLATSMLGSVIWDKKPLKLYFINIGYQFIVLLLIGALLGYWQ